MWFDETVCNLFGVNQRTGQIGIEIEVEGRGLPTEVLGWRVERDGSLRGESLEYVFGRPVNAQTVSVLLERLDKAFRNAEATVNDSVRAGVHVHMNVGNASLKQVYTFLTAYYALEELIVDQCGEGRQGNLFCLRAHDAEYVIDAVCNSLVHHTAMELCTDAIRYAAMNLASLGKYGSLEFRAIRTPTNGFINLDEWAQMLLTVWENTNRIYNNPVRVVEGLSFGGELPFAQEIFGTHARKFLTNNPQEDERKIRRGIRLAQEIAYTIQSWE